MIPLDKKPGCRPVGIGEILRRIIGKCIMEITKFDVKDATGNLQVCAGHQAGGEAAIHAMRKIFEDEGCEAVLLVDASNAFNTINREAMLHNISIKCRPLSQYVKNTYGTPSEMYVTGSTEKTLRKKIISSEGTTQGDPTAMSMYAIGISVLQTKINHKDTHVKHVGYADDIAGAGKLMHLRQWWEEMQQLGPTFGYYPNAKKSWVIAKPDKVDLARELFKNTDVQVTDEGQRHLGAVIGSMTFRKKYIQEKVGYWISEIEKLAEIAKTEPHAAYTAFTFGLKQKWNYISRTIPGVGSMLQPMEKCIKRP